LPQAAPGRGDLRAFPERQNDQARAGIARKPPLDEATREHFLSARTTKREQ